MGGIVPLFGNSYYVTMLPFRVKSHLQIDDKEMELCRFSLPKICIIDGLLLLLHQK